MAYWELGTAYLNLSEYEPAIELYGRVVRFDPDFVFPRADRTMAYTHLGKDAEAKLDIDRAVAMGFEHDALVSEIEEIKSRR